MEITCINPDCGHKFKILQKGKTVDSILICPKCGFEFSLQEFSTKLVIEMLKSRKDERNS